PLHHLGGEAAHQPDEVARAIAVVEAAERPDAAAGRHAAEKRRLVDEHRAEPRPRGGDRSRRPRRSAADDDQVRVLDDRNARGRYVADGCGMARTRSATAGTAFSSMS